MADYFQSSPNFVNPAYATPEQLANQRAYADALMKRSGEAATRPSGVIGNALDAVAAALNRNRANEMQSEAAGRNSAGLAALISQLQNGQKIDPATAARVYADPMASPEHRALVGALITPRPVEDVAGRPGYMAPASGVQAAPVQGNFQPGFRQPVATPGASTTIPIPAAMAPQPARIPSTPKVWGDKEAEAAGIYPKSNPATGVSASSAPSAGLPAPAPGLPPAAAPAANFLTLDALAAKGREIAAENERAQGGAKGEADVINKDVSGAASAPETLKGLAIMRDTINTVGDKMTFGPTAKFSNEFRRVVDNYAPGLIDKGGLAGADAIEKLNLSLAGRLSQQLGLNPSDIQRSIASVPGVEKSKEGTLALIGMLEQSARNDQYVGTRIYQQNKGNLANYQQARQDYYDSHPIVNPITGRPVQIGAESAPAPSSGPVRVTSVAEARKLPSGTRIILPDGSPGRVP